jgi:RHS repeat-associated protein
MNLYNLRARWYGPKSGRFATADKFELDIELRSPFDDHRYLYGLAAPANKKDPTGLAVAVGVAVRRPDYQAALAFSVRHVIGFGVGACTTDYLFVGGGPCSPGQQHRGRFQVQGADMRPELSIPWLTPIPLPSIFGHMSLLALRSILTKDQLARRTEAFAKAHRFITNARAGGGVGPNKYTFQNAPTRRLRVPDARVDIEVLEGLAFVFP